MEIILRCERQRRREEGWPASERGDDAREEIAETDSSGDFSQLLSLGLVAAIVLILIRF